MIKLKKDVYTEDEILFYMITNVNISDL